MEIEKMPKSFFTKIQKKYMQPFFSRKNKIDCKLQQTQFSFFCFRTFLKKNENWTFLKMSKSAKNSRKFCLKKHTFFDPCIFLYRKTPKIDKREHNL